MAEIQKKEADTQDKAERTRERRIYTPAVDIIERKTDTLVIADMPGVDEKSIDVNVEKRVLTIYGKVDAEIPENHRLSFAEYGIGDYQRVFTLSDEVNTEKIQASVKKGVLKLILPKADAARSMKIPVSAGA